MSKSRTVGVTHVALEVGDIDVALAFYGEFLSFQLRGQIDEAMFVDRSDQLLVFVEVHCQEGDESRHLGLIVEDKAVVQAPLVEMSVELLPGSHDFLDFLDLWGNRIRIVG